MNELRAKDYAVSTTPPTAPKSTEGEVSSSNFIMVVWRRKWLIAAILFLALVLFVVWMRSVTPLFTAASTVKLDVYQPGIVDIDSVVSGVTGDNREIRSQLQVARSRSLMARVVDALDLTNDPEFNPRLRPVEEPSIFSYISLNTIRRMINRQPEGEESGPTELPPEEIRERAIDILIKRVSVIPVHYSFVFSISVKTWSPEKSALIANTVAEQYILNQIETKYNATEQATAWLSNRVSELQVVLENAEEAVASHRAAHEYLEEEVIELLNARVAQMRQTRLEVEANREEAIRKKAELEALVVSGDLTAAAAASGSIRLENLARTITQNGGPEADVTQAAMERFNREMQGVLDRLDREIAQSGSTLASVEAQVSEMEDRQAVQAEELVRLRQLEREAQAASLIYETFLSRLKETSVQQGVHKADAVIISSARVPKIRSFPRFTVAAGAALLIGLLISAVIIAILEMLDQTFSTPDEVESYTGVPVLGMIPRAPFTARGNVLKYMLDKPSSVFVESVRNLRTSIQLSGVDGDVQVVAMASAGQSEGKTMLSMALAMSSATQQTQRVLVMDCDLRRRRLTTELGGRGKPGLIGYFAGKREIDDIITPHDVAEFDVIYADKSPKITADIFASHKFETLMGELRRRYDIIIIDTPPVLALTDVRVISAYADLVLFSISWKRTKRRLVRTAMSALAMTKQRRVATVFNRMNIAKSIGYYGSYYYK